MSKVRNKSEKVASRQGFLKSVLQNSSW